MAVRNFEFDDLACLQEAVPARCDSPFDSAAFTTRQESHGRVWSHDRDGGELPGDGCVSDITLAQRRCDHVVNWVEDVEYEVASGHRVGRVDNADDAEGDFFLRDVLVDSNDLVTHQAALPTVRVRSEPDVVLAVEISLVDLNCGRQSHCEVAFLLVDRRQRELHSDAGDLADHFALDAVLFDFHLSWLLHLNNKAARSGVNYVIGRSKRRQTEAVSFFHCIWVSHIGDLEGDYVGSRDTLSRHREADARGGLEDLIWGEPGATRHAEAAFTL